jgi:hypothetical protein
VEGTTARGAQHATARQPELRRELRDALCDMEANPKSSCADNAGFEKTAAIQSACNNAYSAPPTSAFGALAISSALAPVLFVSAFQAALCSFAAW